MTYVVGIVKHVSRFITILGAAGEGNHCFPPSCRGGIAIDCAVHEWSIIPFHAGEANV